MSISMTELRALGRELSNWGRWGPEDERGTLNLITPERVAQAAAEVRRGATFRLSMPTDEKGPYDQRTSGRFNPIRRMTGYRGDNVQGEFFDGVRFSEDMLVLNTHSGTHVDALAHCWYDDRIYNGFDAATTITSWGARRCDVEAYGAGVVARGLLIDLPRFFGVPYLAPDTIVAPADLDATLTAASLKPRSGDVLLIRTGTYPARRRGTDTGAGHLPGLSWECAAWLRKHDIAVVCADNWAVETTRANEGGPAMPMHMLALRDMGMPLGELFDFEDLAADCADDGVSSCMFIASPLHLPGGTGSPLNAVAVK